MEKGVSFYSGLPDCQDRRTRDRNKSETLLSSAAPRLCPTQPHINLCSDEALQAEAYRSEPPQPAVKTPTHRLPHKRKKRRRKKKQRLMSWNARLEHEEDAFIHLFCLFSKTNTRSGLCCNTDSLLSVRVKFQINRFTLPTFMVISKHARCPPPHPNEIAGRVSSKSSLELKETLTCGLHSLCWTLDGAIQLGWKPEHRALLQNVTACCVVHVDV